MNIDDRIERRLDGEPGTGVFVDFDAVSPVSHVDSPVGRGPMIERLLDAFQPALSGSAPPTVYVYGPKGSGKSAVVAALFERLAARGGPRRAIQTTTRAVEPAVPGFAYVDARRASTRFRLYRALLSATTDEPVPGRGVGTDELTETLRGAVRTGPDLVVAVDHVGEPETPSPAALREWLGGAGEGRAPAWSGPPPPGAGGRGRARRRRAGGPAGATRGPPRPGRCARGWRPREGGGPPRVSAAPRRTRSTGSRTQPSSSRRTVATFSSRS